MKIDIPHRLSLEALNELRAIVKDEIVEPMTDAEIEEMGVRLLRLFSIISVPEQKPSRIEPTEQEQKAIAYISSEIKSGRSPSIRDITKAMGLRSSHSGFRLLNRLIEKGMIRRCEQGILHMR